MKNKKLLIAAIILILAVITFAVYYFQNKKETNMVKVTVAEARWPGNALLAVAREKGFFRKQGLDVSVEFFSSGKESLNSLIANKVDFASVSETNVAYVSFAPTDVKILTTYTEFNDNKLVGRKDKGIQSPSDLRGKKIASFKGTTAEITLNEFLRINGLSRSDIEFVHLIPQAIFPALLQGEIDAFVIWEPFASRALEELGNNAITFDTKNAYQGFFNLATTQKYLENNKNVAERMLKALLEAEKYITTHQEETKQLAASQSGIERTYLEKFWSDYQFHLQLDRSLLILLEKEFDWINGQKPENEKINLPNYREFIDESFLQKVSPERVNL